MSNALASAPLDAAAFVKSQIRTVPDWPQAGVQFRDITPLLQHPKTFRVLIDLFVQRYIDAKLDYIAGLDARGFIIGPVLAYELNVGFIPIRKAGKLPYKTESAVVRARIRYGDRRDSRGRLRAGRPRS